MCNSRESQRSDSSMREFESEGGGVGQPIRHGKLVDAILPGKDLWLGVGFWSLACGTRREANGCGLLPPI